MEHLSSLNEKQLEAVVATEGYLRVIAGAGSGKTKLLVSRYAYLVKDYGIDSANILCVTFTNKAAGEMKRRIRAIIGQEYDTSLICTYHGFCVRVLREDIEKIFYPKEFQIIDNSQQKALLSDIYQKFELKLDHASFEKIVKQIAYYKSKRSYIAKMCSRDNCQILESITTLDDKIIEEFLQRQRQLYAMDFNDLMYFTLDIFARCPEVLEKWQDRLNYIQVDEFQDSSSTEMELVDLLSGKHKNLMIVGDPDQNIYEWRGSDVKLLVDFDKEHIPTKTVFLNRNYRSTPQILKCANALIEKNVFRLKKELYTKSNDGFDVFHYHMKNEYAEAERIVERIHEIKKENGCNYADFAVLYRSGFLSRVIEKKFTENGVPYEIFGGVKFYLRMEIQDVMAYLRLAAFDDDISFKRIINTPRRRFGRAKLQHLLSLQSDGASLYETLKANIDDPIFKKSGAKAFCDMIEGIRAVSDKQPLSDTFEKLCAESGYEKYIRELGDMERFENLSEFKRIVAEYEKNFGEEVPLKEFINHIALQSEDDGEEACDMVKLMTIHAAKGLEFPNVFVVGFSEGIFPSSKTIEERKQLGLEEERRLCYVAITRAEKRLMLLDSEGYTQNGKQKLPSRFLKEIGEDNYIRIGTISKELQQSADEYAAKLFGEPINSEAKQVGDRVSHPAFGEGTVIGKGKNGNSLRIKFDNLSSERDISADFFNRKTEPIVIPKPSESEDETINALPCLVENSIEPIVDNAAPIQSNAPEAQFDSLNGYEPVSERTFYKEAEEKEAFAVAERSTPKTEDFENLWKRDDVPKSDWMCVGITDLGEPVGVCEMCGHQIIRYVHHMVHPMFRPLGVGCICAGKMEGSIENARKREQEYKSKQARKANFKSRKWKISKNNNRYVKIKDHLIVLYYSRSNNNWKYSIDNVFCNEHFPTENDAVDAAFEAFENKLKHS
ncbi:MAG: UvrD-helicase domain-containing protein [Clostridia bacterium]|nr:UvrD-helicase domain-containing protein [Clostridia bacterium]